MRAALHTVVAFLLLSPGLAFAWEVVDEGRAEVTPWSGYWWPHRQGAILQPLEKYDRLTGRQAASWERRTHPAGPQVPGWHGYCHAWAASSLMEAEPTTPRTIGTSKVELSVGDQKGLLAMCHTQDVAHTYGDRFGDGEGSEDSQDLPPDELWRLLKLYVRQQGVPLVLDIDAGPAVWNHPVYAYEVRYAPQGSEGEHVATMKLWLADGFVPLDFVGTKTQERTYRFAFRLVDGSVEMGSGRWIGASLREHPDFAWYPFDAVAENPEIRLDLVRALVSAGDSPARTESPRPSSSVDLLAQPEVAPPLPTPDEPPASAVLRADSAPITIPRRGRDPQRLGLERAGFSVRCIDSLGRPILLMLEH